jgi:hypothetical protein
MVIYSGLLYRKDNTVNRRNFLKMAGIGLVAPAIPMAAATKAAGPVNLIQDFIDAHPEHFTDFNCYEFHQAGYPGFHRVVSVNDSIVKIEYIEPEDIYLK